MENGIDNQKTIYVYVDESGSITKTNISNNRYFVANSFYRNIEKKNMESRENVNMWIPMLCNGDIFDFSESHDIALNLPT